MKNLRWDLLSLPIVIAIISAIVYFFGKPGTAGIIWLYIMNGVVLLFVLYWLITGQLKK